MSRSTSGFEPMRKGSLLIVRIFLSVFLLSAVPAAVLGAAGPRIVEVTAHYEDQPPQQELRNLVPLSEGEPYSLKRVSEAIKHVYRTGLFSDIRVIKEGDGDVRLDFVFEKLYATGRIDFSGAPDIPVKTMRDSLTVLREGQAYDPARLRRAVDEIRSALEREGYFEPQIRAVPQEDPKQARVDVLFEVNLPARFTVGGIVFTGDVVVAKKELEKRMRTRPGRPFVPAVLTEDIARLREYFLSLDYRQVEIKEVGRTFDEDKRTVALAVEVNPREKIDIIVRGAQVPLRLLMPIWEARVFEEWGLQEGEAKILTYLRKKRHLFATVRSRIERDSDVLRVIHEVDPGEKFRILDAAFKGLVHFSPAEVRNLLGIRQNIPLLSGVDGARLFERPAEIEYLYSTEGFPDCRVDLTFERLGRNVRPIFQIEEGRRETIDDVFFEGAELFGPFQLSAQISVRADGPFYEPNIQKDIGQLEEFYMNQGIRGTEVSARIETVGVDRYVVRFQIKEGRPMTVDQVIIAGNAVTKRKTILREVLLKSGDPARFNLIRMTKRRLDHLGIFTEVQIEEIPVSEGRENIFIRVQEGERNYASLGLGLETKQEPRSFEVWNIPVRLRATGEYIRNNIFGSAHQLSLIGQFSLREKRVVASWEQPYFFRLPMDTYINGWLEREVRKSYSFDRRGISLSTIYSPSKRDDLVLLGTLRLARTTLFDLQILESAVDRQHFPYSTTSLSGSMIWDRRDDPFNPERGHFLSTVLEWAYPLFNTESDYLKMFFKHQKYFPLLPRVLLGTTVRFGLGAGKMPIHERFFAGGSSSFRGLDFDELGPLDEKSEKPIGGKALILLNIELTFPIAPGFKDLFGVIFYDTGNVFAQRRDFDLADLEDAFGLGLRYRTPLGPVRFEIGWNPDAPEGASKFKFFITIGNLF